jgi:acetolactate synthase I/II/III large subunit
MKLTASELVAETLVREGMPYVIGVPGHGILPMVDALRKHQDKIKVIMPRHEQSAVHMADGYYRVKGEPLAVYTSIGAGASNAPIGLATAYVDSVPLLLLVGETHTHMRGVGVLQEIERKRWSDLPSVLEPVTKKAWRIDIAQQLPRALGQAFNAMYTGRPGPALITLPMDVQADSIEVAELPQPQAYRPHSRQMGDPTSIRQAAELLINAKRPVIVCGGGVTLSRAEEELLALAEHLGAAVVSTMQGKGSFPEDHPLYAWHMGSNATTCGNSFTVNADVLLAVGMRFADKATCSYKPGEAFNFPPTKLIHVDIDPSEIGKNYPVEVGIVGDAKAVLGGLAATVAELTTARQWRDAPYTKEIAERVAAWLKTYQPAANKAGTPPTMGNVIAEVRKVLPQEGIVLTSSGNAQAQVFQEMGFTKPRTYITAGGFSTMGWAYPAALGAQLAAPETPVVAMIGDGDFLMTIQELATAVQYNIPVVAVVMNNAGWQAIRDLQQLAFGPETAYATMFEQGGHDNQSGAPVTPKIAEIATAFGAHGVRVTKPEDVGPAVAAALAARKPAVVEVMIDMGLGTSGGQAPGWWDVPIPGYFPERRATYEEAKKKETI